MAEQHYLTLLFVALALSVIAIAGWGRGSGSDMQCEVTHAAAELKTLKTLFMYPIPVIFIVIYLPMYVSISEC